MGIFQDLKEAQAYFAADRFATENGMQLDELTGDTAVCSAMLTERHKNANGGVMGGAIFTLADLAFAALANQIHRPTVAQQVSVNFLGAPRGQKLIARASCKKDGRSSLVVIVDVTDDTGRAVAQFTGLGFKL